MKIGTGVLISITDDKGAVFGIDSKFVKDLVDKHGDDGVFVHKLRDDLVITLSYYTEHESTWLRLKRAVLNWVYLKQVEKLERRNKRMRSGTQTEIPPQDPEQGLFQQPLKFTLQPPSVSPPTFDITKPAAGPQDDATFQGESGVNENARQ